MEESVLKPSSKKMYVIYGGDDIPYETYYPLASFLDKNKAEEFLQKLKEEDAKNRELNEEYTSVYNQYYDYMDENNLVDEEDDIVCEALSKEFGVSKEYANNVINFYYYPQVYYIRNIDFYD